MYLDNVLKGDDHVGIDITTGGAGEGNIILGRYFADNHDSGLKYGDFKIDYLTVWDKPLSEVERKSYFNLKEKFKATSKLVIRAKSISKTAIDFSFKIFSHKNQK